MDPSRLCVKFTHPDTECRGPHLVSDIVSCLVEKKEDDVRVLSVCSNEFHLTVNGQDVRVRLNRDEADWYSVVCNGKVACLSPLRTSNAIVGANVEGGCVVPIHHLLHKDWSEGKVSKEDEIMAKIEGEFVSWHVAPITYADPSTFVDAIHLVLEPTSIC